VAVRELEIQPVASARRAFGDRNRQNQHASQRAEIDPIVGRDEEIRQIVDILMRRRQNNPILTGEAGVGKTAVVEGFALRIARATFPPR
jgi:ATP-dependent Clp protease ATP-binding subunit ClpA